LKCVRSKTTATNKKPFRVDRNYPKILRNRKHRIERRLKPQNWEDQPRPMLIKASNIVYEMAKRAQGMNCGGIGAMHLMVQRLGLVEDLDRNLALRAEGTRQHATDLQQTSARQEYGDHGKRQEIQNLADEWSISNRPFVFFDWALPPPLDSLASDRRIKVYERAHRHSDRRR
jgi:hypothetical protein